MKFLNSVFLITILLFPFAGRKKTTNISSTCRQMILVITDSAKASEGSLYCFEREGGESWKMLEKTTPVVIGRNGLGWGRGLHKETGIHGFPQKMEGDGRSPAGIFNLSMVFGFKPAIQMTGLKMPYLQLTQPVECVDDLNSEHYNQIVTRQDCDSIDWNSSEKMSSIDLYETGVVVDHNAVPVNYGGGSCIFLHLWRGSGSTTSGCTAMDSTAIHDVAYWLDKSKNPVLVQLTRQLYYKLKGKWNLPKIPD